MLNIQLGILNDEVFRNPASFQYDHFLALIPSLLELLICWKQVKATDGSRNMETKEAQANRSKNHLQKSITQ